MLGPKFMGSVRQNILNSPKYGPGLCGIAQPQTRGPPISGQMTNDMRIIFKLPGEPHIKSNIPVQILSLLENMLFICHKCVKWENIQSAFFTVAYGVRQGSVLAPF